MPCAKYRTGGGIMIISPGCNPDRLRGLSVVVGIDHAVRRIHDPLLHMFRRIAVVPRKPDENA